MKLNVDDLRHALDIIGGAGGVEAAIVAQFALDLATTARFQRADRPITPEEAERLLRLRIARRRATQCTSSSTVH